jgi:hypothetical protein
MSNAPAQLTLNRLLNALPLLAALFGAAVFLWATRLGGIGTSPDSLSYLTAGRTLLAGEGLQRYANLPFTSWPPVLPVALGAVNALSRALGLDGVEGVRYVYLLLYMGMLFGAGLLLRRYLRSPLLIGLALLYILLTPNLISVTTFVLSEPPYIVISLLFLALLPAALESGRLWPIALLGVLAIVGSMLRYASFGIIPAGMVCIVLFMRGRSLRARLLIALAFGLCALPYLLWFLYGRSLPTINVTPQADPVQSLARNFELTPLLLNEWFVPPALSGWLSAALVTLTILGVLTWALWDYFRAARSGDVSVMNFDNQNRYRVGATWQVAPTANALPKMISKIHQAGDHSRRTHPAVPATYVLVYMAMYYAANALIRTTPIDQRHLSVLFIVVIVLIFCALERLWPPGRGWRWGLTGVLLVVLLHPTTAFLKRVDEITTACCAGAQYRTLPVIQWLNAEQPAGRIYSNTPIPLVFTTLRVRYAPVSREQLEDWRSYGLSSDQDTYLVIFHQVETLYQQVHERFYRNVEYSEDDLRAIAEVEVAAAFPEATVYRLRGTE